MGHSFFPISYTRLSRVHLYVNFNVNQRHYTYINILLYTDMCQYVCTGHKKLIIYFIINLLLLLYFIYIIYLEVCIDFKYLYVSCCKIFLVYLLIEQIYQDNTFSHRFKVTSPSFNTLVHCQKPLRKCIFPLLFIYSLFHKERYAFTRKVLKKTSFFFWHNSAHKALGRTHLINRLIAVVLDNGLASSGHALDQFFGIFRRQRAPYLLNSSRELLQGICTPSCKFPLHNTPHIFYWIRIRRL